VCLRVAIACAFSKKSVEQLNASTRLGINACRSVSQRQSFCFTATVVLGNFGHVRSFDDFSRQVCWRPMLDALGCGFVGQAPHRGVAGVLEPCTGVISSPSRPSSRVGLTLLLLTVSTSPCSSSCSSKIPYSTFVPFLLLVPYSS
jgi:hypothetical protein